MADEHDELSDEEKADLEAKKAEEEVLKKKEEEEAAAKKAAGDAAAKKAAEEEAARKQQASITPGAVSEDQMKKLEEQTGFNRQQLVTLGFYLSSAQKPTGVMVKAVEKVAMDTARENLSGLGVKDFDAHKKAIEVEMEKMTPEDRQNPDKVQNTYWIVKGKSTVSAGGGGGTVRRVITGVSGSGGGREEASSDEDVSSLSEEEQDVYKRYNFKSVKAFKASQRGDFDMKELYKPPTFGGK